MQGGSKFLLVKLLIKKLRYSNSDIYSIVMVTKNTTNDYDWFDLNFYKNGNKIERIDINNATMYDIIKHIESSLDTIGILDIVDPGSTLKCSIDSIKQMCDKIVWRYINNTDKVIAKGNEYVINLLDSKMQPVPLHKVEKLKTSMFCRQVNNKMEIIIGENCVKSVTLPIDVFNELFLVYM